MKEFIAKLGYTMCWAFGTPTQTLDNNIDGYYTFGMYIIVFFTLLLFVGIITVLISLIKEKEGKK